MVPLSSTLDWKIPRMEKPGRLQSMGSLRVGHDWVTSLSLFAFHFHALEKEMATYSSVLAWRIPGMGKPGGLPSMGSHRVGHDWSDLAAAAAKDKEAWRAAVHGVAKSRIRLSDWTTATSWNDDHNMFSEYPSSHVDAKVKEIGIIIPHDEKS